MAWEKRGNLFYYYRSVRCDGKVKKVYYGSGLTGRLAADMVARHQAERKAARLAHRAMQEQISKAVALNEELGRACDLLAAASLLAAGFHRPCRHRWRIWRNGRKALKQSV